MNYIQLLTILVPAVFGCLILFNIIKMIFAGFITKNSIEFLAGLTGLLVSIILVIHYLRLAER